jgi:hypothetical protein
MHAITISITIAIVIAMLVAYLIQPTTFTLLLSVVIGALVGGILSYSSQLSSQQSQWKRDSEIRRVDLVYGPLYEETSAVISALSYSRGYLHQLPDLANYEKIKRNYNFLLVEKHLRQEVHILYKAVSNLRRLEGLLSDNAYNAELVYLKKLWGSDVIAYTVRLSIKRGDNSFPFEINPKMALLEGKDLNQIAYELYPYADSYHFQLIIQKNGKPEESYDLATDPKAHTFMQDLRNAIQSDPASKQITAMAQELMASAGRLQEKLRKAIEQPWNV